MQRVLFEQLIVTPQNLELHSYIWRVAIGLYLERALFNLHLKALFL